MDIPKDKDQFKDNTFSYKGWSAKTLKTTSDVLTRLKEFNIIGHQITDFQILGGYAKNLTMTDFSDKVYDIADAMSYEERKGINPYVWHDSNIPCTQGVIVDDPTLITLDDGNQIELVTVALGGLRISKNRLSATLESCYYRNFNCKFLFSNFIDKKIIGFEVHIPEDESIRDEIDFFAWDAYYRFVFEDGTKLQWSDDIDYTYLCALDATNTPIKVPLWKFEKSAIPELKFDNYRICGPNEKVPMSLDIWKLVESLEYPAKPYPTLEEKAELIQLAQSGDAEAQFQLGYLYFGEAEIHGAVMYDWAYEWLFKAANQNHPKALFKLAYLYDCGPKEWRNLEKAIEMYDRASKCGHENAADYLEMMDDQELVKKVLGENYNKKP